MTDTPEQKVFFRRTRVGTVPMTSNADTPDPILEAVEALRAHGIAATPVGDDFERWRIGDLTYDDAAVIRLAESMKLVDAADGER